MDDSIGSRTSENERNEERRGNALARAQIESGSAGDELAESDDWRGAAESRRRGQSGKDALFAEIRNSSAPPSSLPHSRAHSTDAQRSATGFRAPRHAAGKNDAISVESVSNVSWTSSARALPLRGRRRHERECIDPQLLRRTRYRLSRTVECQNSRRTSLRRGNPPRNTSSTRATPSAFRHRSGPRQRRSERREFVLFEAHLSLDLARTRGNHAAKRRRFTRSACHSCVQDGGS